MGWIQYSCLQYEHGISSQLGEFLTTTPTMSDAPQTLPPRDPRRHDLDALRAFAMLLGIILHAALAFMFVPWVVQDRYQSEWYGVLVASIHAFRMPVFFMLSGFFTTMLWRKRGLSGLIRHRAKRILLPLLLGMCTVVPLMWGMIHWANASRGEPAWQQEIEHDASRDLWTASAMGDLVAVRLHVEEGADVNAPDPKIAHTPLAWAAIGDHPRVAEFLLESGADPNVRYGEANVALHTAAFFGRAGVARALIDAGADTTARNRHGETPLESLGHAEGTTKFIAGLINLPIDFEEVRAGREEIRALIEEKRAALALTAEEVAPETGAAEASLRKLYGLLFEFPFFHHLWFLWHLCWLIGGFAIVVSVLGKLPQFRLPVLLVGSPLALLWLVPLTMLGQSTMHGFGPDTSAGILPMPHVLAYYALFFGYGAMLYTVPGGADRVSLGWWAQLGAAVLILPAALGIGLNMDWIHAYIDHESSRMLLSLLLQSLYAWLMIFGLMGLCRVLLGRQRPGVRYMSDASYWLYVAHLPLIIAGQILLRDVDLPSWAKFTILSVGTTLILLAAYELFVRYTWLGTLLNGPRKRPRDEASKPPTELEPAT